jgi:hypothetical protein
MRGKLDPPFLDSIFLLLLRLWLPRDRTTKREARFKRAQKMKRNDPPRFSIIQPVKATDKAQPMDAADQKMPIDLPRVLWVEWSARIAIAAGKDAEPTKLVTV